MTRTRYTLRDVGGALPWGALLHFVEHLGHDSATWRAANPEDQTHLWLDGSMVAPILADLYDLLNQRSAGKSRQRPYPRPWAKNRSTERYGRKPIPIRDFDAWWDETCKGA